MRAARVQMKVLVGDAGSISATSARSSPFKGEVRWGMGENATESKPIPTPALPLKGREWQRPRRTTNTFKHTRAARLVLPLLIALAAMPAAAADSCVTCHAGAAARSYALSKHGVIARLDSGRARTRAPGCSDCHTHEAKSPGPAHYASGVAREQARKQAVAGCGSCHAPRFVAEQLAAAERGQAIGEMKLREAQSVVDTARREAGGKALAAIEARFKIMRAEHMRDLRLGLAHQSPDYQWWHGQAALDGDLLRVKGALAEARRELPGTRQGSIR